MEEMYTPLEVVLNIKWFLTNGVFSKHNIKQGRNKTPMKISKLPDMYGQKSDFLFEQWQVKEYCLVHISDCFVSGILITS